MYTPKITSELLDIPVSSLRRYAKLFSKQLSEHANKPRRKYTDRDLVILAKVREFSNDGVAIENISTQIAKYAQEIIDDQVISVENTETAITLPGISEELVSLHQRLTGIEQTQSEILALLQQKNRPFWEKWRQPRG